MAEPAKSLPMTTNRFWSQISLGKTYGRLTACRDVSFALYPGEVLAVRRRVRIGQVDPAAIVVGAVRAERRPRFVPDARWRVARSGQPWRSRAALSVPDRLGLCASGPRAGPADGGLGRRQCRRAADGGGLEPLRPHPRYRLVLAGARRDRYRCVSTTRRGPTRAGCGSGYRSRAISSPSRGWCSWTSRPAGSTYRCRRGCST